MSSGKQRRQAGHSFIEGSKGSLGTIRLGTGKQLVVHALSAQLSGANAPADSN